MNNTKQPVRKAVLAVAGFGTRFLPITKTVPKEMLPIGNKPIIQYIVEELAQSGIEEIIFVVNWQKESLANHFDPRLEIEDQLIAQGKHELLAETKKPGQLARFIFIRQGEGYGNALPLLAAREIIGDEPFIYAFGDDLVKSTIPFTKQIIDAYHEHGLNVVGVQEVAQTDVVKYGIVKLENGSNLMETMIEKPSIEEAPSTLAVFGRYLFTPEIFSVLDSVQEGRSGEYWVTDAVEMLAEKRLVATQPVTGGKWLTTGDPANYLSAVIEYAKDDPELSKIINQ